MKKRIVALLMAGIMCVTFAGCGKESKKSKKQDKYYAVQQKVIEHNTGEVIVVDDVLYGIYYKDNDAGNEEEMRVIFRLDLNSKELTEKEIDNNVHIESMYAINGDKLVLSGMQVLKNENTMSEEEKKTDKLYCNVEYVYDTDLNQLSKEVSESVNDINNLNVSEEVISSVVLKEGKTVLLCTINGIKFWIKIKDNEGNELAVIELEYYADNLLLLKNGKVLCGCSKNGIRCVYEIDVDNGKLGNQIADFSSYDISSWCADKGNKMLFTTNTAMFECDCNTGKISKIFNLMDCDINWEDVKCIFRLSDGTLGIVSNYDGFAEIYYVHKQDKNTKKKAEITVGVLYLSSALKEDILRFNRSHDDVRISVKEYYRDNEENYAEARAEFNSDILSGNCPDIIDFGPINADINQYIEKGLIDELTPYFEKDEEISIEDFIPSVVEACKVNGKLYVLPEAFSLKGFFGASSVVGEESGWTLEEFMEVVNKFEKGTEICQFRAGENMISLLCSNNIGKYIDWSKGECYFDTGEFADMLEFSYAYVKSEDNKKNKDDDISEITKIRDKQQILLQFDTEVGSCERYMFAKEVFGEDVTFKGFPLDEGNGVVIVSSMDKSHIAISSKSKYKEEAWEVVRNRYLPKKDKITDYYCFPIRQDDLDYVLNKAMIPYTDEKGNISYSAMGIGDVTITIPYPTEEDVAEIKKIINSADTMANGNEKIMEIINEEAEAFYQGQKSADEVAKIIQSRVSLYVKESQ